MIWLTSDQHFWHDNIIKYCDRPFDNAKEMNRVIIDNYRESGITNEDEVFMLGDLMLGGPVHKSDLEMLMDRLPGRKHLITGNHDWLAVRDYLDVGFATVHSYLQWEDGVTLVHDPAAATGKGLYLTGHVHNVWETLETRNGGYCVNVGVDVHNFGPVKLSTIMED